MMVTYIQYTVHIYLWIYIVRYWQKDLYINELYMHIIYVYMFKIYSEDTHSTLRNSLIVFFIIWLSIINKVFCKHSLKNKYRENSFIFIFKISSFVILTNLYSIFNPLQSRNIILILLVRPIYSCGGATNLRKMSDMTRFTWGAWNTNERETIRIYVF